jgi:hypothetical protein
MRSFCNVVAAFARRHGALEIYFTDALLVKTNLSAVSLSAASSTWAGRPNRNPAERKHDQKHDHWLPSCAFA